MRLGPALVLLLLTAPMATLLAAGPGSASEQTADLPEHKVVVGVPDTGINPYHEAFYRPGLTEHPSTYIDSYPEDAQRLDLSIETARDQGYDAARDADADVWDGLESNTLYWIPKTSIVAAVCLPESQRGGFGSDGSATCILDDGTDHGTATTGAVARANEEALIAFKQGGPGLDALLDEDVPMDLASVSWGNLVPVPFPRPLPEVPLYFTSAGNTPVPTVVDGWAGHPDVIAVGGAYADRSLFTSHSSEPSAAKTPDIVSSFCLQLPHPTDATATQRRCGTSFGAPTAAGGFSKAILEHRRASGYEGVAADGMLDPTPGFEVGPGDARDALNVTATYDPANRGANPATVNGPVLAHAPWLQWGWGFYDGNLADETLEHLLGQQTYEKPEAAHLWMETVYDVRSLWG